MSPLRTHREQSAAPQPRSGSWPIELKSDAPAHPPTIVHVERDFHLRYVLWLIAVLLLLIFLAEHGWAQQAGPARLQVQSVGGSFLNVGYAAGNLVLPVNCTAGCSSSGGGTSSTFGATFPATGTAVGASFGGNMVSLNADASGNLFVNLNTALPAGANAIGSVSVSNFPATQPVSGTVAVTQSTSPWIVAGGGTAGAAATGVVTIQGIASGTAVSISGNVNASQASNPWTVGCTSAANCPVGVFFGSTSARTNQTTTATGTLDVNIVGSLGVTNSVTNGTFMAITDNTTKAGVIATTTSLKTDQSSQAGTAITTVPVAFGSGTPSGNAPGVNAALFMGTTAARTNQTTTAAGVQDVNIVGSLGVTNSVTNGTFIAITDNTTKAGVIAATTSLKTDYSSEAGTAVTTVPVAFGTGTPSGNAPGGNSALYVGTTAVRSNQTTTATGAVDVNVVGTLGATNSATNGMFARVTDNTNAITAAVSALGTAPTGTEVMAVNNVVLPTTAAGAAVSTTSLSTSATTTGTNIKASAGNLYGIFAINGVASTCWVQFINSATGGTLGTGAIVSFPLPASTTQPIWIPLPYPINFTTGIAVGTSTTNNGAVACGTATALVVQFK